MLGVVPYDREERSEQLMRQLATELGIADTYSPTPVGVFLAEPGVTVPDPYSDGVGPPRTGCIRCGQCMLGCRFNAKKTLPKNYLWLAERRGAHVVAERRVTDVRPLGALDGGDGYLVTSERAGAPVRRDRRDVSAAGVIVAAGAVGTNELLRRCRDSGSLPNLSARLGELVRTNSEAITAATSLEAGADLRAGVAITASIHPDDSTHVTNNTYGDGGDAVALTYGPLTGGGRLPRPVQLAMALARHPLRALRHLAPRGWSRRSVIFTVMQSTDNSLRLRPTRRGRLQTEHADGEPPRSYLPIANEIARLAARRIGGYAQTSLAESLLSTPTTAHFVGGAVIGADAAHGVIDRHRRAFGYERLLVCDGASIPANVGMNPSLTIVAMAEEAMSHIPPNGGERAGPRESP